MFKLIKTNDMPATNAMIFISICQFLNLSFVYIIIKYLLNIDFKFTSKLNIYIFTIPIGLLVYLINYFFLYKNRNRLNEKYMHETENQKYFGKILLGLYIFFSFFLVFYFGIRVFKI